MTYREVKGDLFAQGMPAIGHGCNCRGTMNGGIAREVSKRYPQMHREYVDLCEASRFELGEFFAWEAPEFVVYNLATQKLPGANADLNAITTSVRSALADASHRGLSMLGLPKIGAGIGGLQWSEVSQALQAVAASSRVDVVVASRD